ncbi:hypothetical protein ACLOJK_039604 [Asimina triloba]
MDRTLAAAARSGNVGFLTQLSISDPSHLLLQLTPKKNTALHIASRHGHRDFAAAISTLCPPIVTTENSNGDTALHVAAKAGQPLVVELLIGIFADRLGARGEELLRKRNKDGKTALHEAVWSRDRRVLELLVNADQELSIVANSSGVSPIYLAVEGGSLENARLLLRAHNSSADMMRMLLQEKPQLGNQVDCHGRTPLHYAASQGDHEMVAGLLESDVSTAYIPDKDSFFPIHMAACNSHVGIIRDLLRCCPDSGELVDARGWNVLHVAIDRKDLRVVKYVLQAPGLEDLINEPDNDGNTPLHLAVTNDRPQIVQILVADERVDLRATNSSGLTALDIARSNNELTMILQKRADKNVKEDGIERRLHKAVTQGNTRLLNQVVDQCPDLLLGTTPQKNTALHIAARLGHVYLVKEILGRCEVLQRRKNARGDTPLHVASRAGHKDIVKYLIKFRSSQAIFEPQLNSRDVNEDFEIWRIRNKANNTPLHEAMLNGRLDVVSLLIGMDPELACFANNADESPLYLAVDRNWLGIVKQILQNSTSFICSGPNGQTALHAAIIRGHLGNHTVLLHYSYLMKELPAKRPELIKQADDQGKTPLHYAASLGKIRIFEGLLQSDLSTAYDIDNEGRSPIHAAASSGHVSIIQHIIGNCSDCTELLDRKGKNALHVAVEEGKTEVVEYALKASNLKELLNEPDNDGNTPLHLAAINRNRPILQILLNNTEVDRSLMNNNHMTAMDICKSDSDLETVVREHKCIALSPMQLLTSRGTRGTTPPPVQRVRRRITAGAVPSFGNWEEAPDSEGQQHQEEVARMGAEVERHIKAANKLEEATTDSLKARATTISLVATLVATVAFSAAFTMPGGYQNNGQQGDGTAILSRRAAFQAFLVLDTLAICLSILIVFVPMWPGIDVPEYSGAAIEVAGVLMSAALYSMLLAFITGVYAVVSFDCKWLAILVCAMGCTTLTLATFFLKSPMGTSCSGLWYWFMNCLLRRRK